MGGFKKSTRLYDQQAKALGLAPILTLSEQEVDSADDFINRLKGRDFWYWSQDQHRQIIKQHGGSKCPCFNHFIKLPTKNGRAMPLWDYQEPWFNALHNHKRLLLRKPVGIGATTAFLRWSIHMATRDNAFRGSEVAILVGPNEALAQGLIQKIRQIFLTANNVVLGGSKTELIINDCLFRAYPSNHLDAIRSRTDLKIILVDELDFYKQDRSILRECIERYVTKSDPYIVCSRPRQGQ